MTHPWISLDKKQAELGQAICRMKHTLSVKIKISTLPFGVHKQSQYTFLHPGEVLITSYSHFMHSREKYLNLVLVSSCDVGDCPARFLLNALFVIVGKKLEEAG